MQTSQQHVGSKGASQQHLGSKRASQQYAGFTTDVRASQQHAGSRQRPNDVNFSVTNGLPYRTWRASKQHMSFMTSIHLLTTFPSSHKRL